MLAIRLQRLGKKKQPTYRVIVSEKHKDTQAGSLEILGHYNPQREPAEIVLDQERIKHWLSVGAQPSNTVHNLLVNAGILKGDKKKSVVITNKRQGKLDTANAEKAQKEVEAKEAEKATKAEAIPEETPEEKTEEVITEEIVGEPVGEEVKEDVLEEVSAEDTTVEEKKEAEENAESTEEEITTETMTEGMDAIEAVEDEKAEEKVEPVVEDVQTLDIEPKESTEESK
jgi:small subunit ribosomal protein S16